jgi:gluconate 2-dehydrogenase gamma chain
MNRRDALRIFAGAAVLPALYPRDLLSLGREIQQHLGPTAAIKTLNPHQNATVLAMSEMIIPATDTPGAKDARVNEFIDLILTDWCRPEDAQRFLAGLAETDARARKEFGKDFVACSPQAQTALLTALDEELTQLREEAGHQRPHASAAKQEEDTPVTRSFFHMLKQLTLVGYYTSEVGWTKELGRAPVHMGPYRPCVPLQEAEQAAAAGKNHAS